MAGVLQWVTVGEVKVLDVNCHECREAFAIDEYLLEFYFECKLICPACAKGGKGKGDKSDEDLQLAS